MPALLAVLLFTSPLRAQLPAEPTAADLAPAGAGVFIRVDNAAELRDTFAQDELVQYLRSLLPDRGDPQQWRDLQSLLGLTGPQIVERYFGRSFAIVAAAPGDGQPWMLLTKIGAQDMRHLATKLNFQPGARVNGFDTWRTAEHDARLAYGHGWLIAVDKQHEEVAARVLREAGGAGFTSLAADPQFQQWSARLPAQRTAFAFARDSEAGEAHALALSYRGKDLSMHYAGQSPKFADMFAKLGQAGALEFGPLPQSTLAAVTLNLINLVPDDTNAADRLLAPRTYEKDIVPHLAAPLVLFLGEVPGEQIEPNPGLAMPVFGLTVKLSNKSVAADLDRMLDNLIVFVNVATSQWRTPPITIDHVPVDDGEAPYTYRVADIGTMLSQRADRAELAPMRLTYGRVGQWYVICSQDAFFRQCLEADRDSTLAFAAGPQLAAMKLNNAEAPIATAVVRGQALAAHLETWSAYWQANRPAMIEEAAQPQPPTPEARFARGIIILKNVLKHHRWVTVQTHRDGDIMHGRVDVVRTDE